MQLREIESDENYVRRLVTGLCTVWNTSCRNESCIESLG